MLQFSSPNALYRWLTDRRLQTYYEFPSNNLATQRSIVVMLQPDGTPALLDLSKPCPLNPKLRLPALRIRARCHSFAGLLIAGSRPCTWSRRGKLIAPEAKPCPLLTSSTRSPSDLKTRRRASHGTRSLSRQNLNFNRRRHTGSHSRSVVKRPRAASSAALPTGPMLLSRRSSEVIEVLAARCCAPTSPILL